MAWSWKGFCSACAAAGAVCVCVATGGLAAPAILAYSAAAGAAGYFVGNSADKENIEREKTLMQDQRYKDAKQAENTQENNNNQNKDLIDQIIGKLNGTIPRKPNETDDYLNQQLVIAQSNLKNGQKRLDGLRRDVDKLRKELGGNGNLMSLLGLDKLSFTDKVLLAGGIVLVIWLLKK